MQTRQDGPEESSSDLGSEDEKTPSFPSSPMVDQARLHEGEVPKGARVEQGSKEELERRERSDEASTVLGLGQPKKVNYICVCVCVFGCVWVFVGRAYHSHPSNIFYGTHVLECRSAFIAVQDDCGNDSYFSWSPHVKQV